MDSSAPALARPVPYVGLDAHIDALLDELARRLRAQLAGANAPHGRFRLRAMPASAARPCLQLLAILSVDPSALIAAEHRATRDDFAHRNLLQRLPVLPAAVPVRASIVVDTTVRHLALPEPGGALGRFLAEPIEALVARWDAALELVVRRSASAIAHAEQHLRSVAHHTRRDARRKAITRPRWSLSA